MRNANSLLQPNFQRVCVPAADPLHYTFTCLQQLSSLQRAVAGFFTCSLQCTLPLDTVACSGRGRSAMGLACQQQQKWLPISGSKAKRRSRLYRH